MIPVKEEFLGSVKTKLAIKLAGSDAVVLWLAIKGYVSASNSGGFVPAEVIPDLEGCPKRWRKALEALVGCGKLQADGTRGAGLLDEVEHGYQLHDYDDHGTPVEVEDERRRKRREQKAAWRAKLKAEAEQLSARPSARLSADKTRQRQDRSADMSPDRPPPAHARERIPQPSPAQPSPENTPHSPPEGGERAIPDSLDRFSVGGRPDPFTGRPDPLGAMVMAAGGPQDAPGVCRDQTVEFGAADVARTLERGRSGPKLLTVELSTEPLAFVGLPADSAARPAHVQNFEASFGPVNPKDEWAFKRWAQHFRKHGAQFDAKRAQCLEDRRLEGMLCVDVDDALAGAEADEWCKGTGYKLSVIFGDRERFEAYRDTGREIRAGTYRPPTKSGVQPPVQPRSGWKPTNVIRGGSK